MKRLISLLGVVSIASSSMAVVVSCKNKADETTFNDPNKQQDISKLVSQYAKSLYLNQNEIDTTSDGLGKIHYSSSYMIENYVRNNTLTELGLKDFKDADVNEFSRYSDISNKYFNKDKSLVSDKLQVGDSVYKGEVITPEMNSTINSIGSLMGSIPGILNSLSNPASFASIIAALQGQIKNFISPELLKTLGTILSNDVLKDLEHAFSVDAYKDDQSQFLSYEDAMNASIIGLANSVDKIINKEESQEKLSAKNSADIDKNINEAASRIADNLSGLMDGSKKFSFDITTDASSIPDVLFFLRTLLVYLNSVSFEEYTEKTFTLNQINKKRIEKISNTSNSFDFEKIIKVLSVIVNDTDKKGSTALKNLLGLLLVTPKDENGKNPNFSSKYEGRKNGLINIVSKLAIKLAGSESIDTSLLKIYIDSFLRSFINYGYENDFLFTIVMGQIPNNSESLSGFLKDLVQNIVGNTTEGNSKNDWDTYFKTYGKWIDYLYDNKNEKLGLSIKKLLQNPLKDLANLPLFGSSTKESSNIFDDKKVFGMEFLTEKSLKDIVNSISDNLGDKKPVIKFDSFAEIFKRLYTNDTFKNATSDINNFMKVFGLEDNGTIKAGSVLEQLQVIIQENVDWINAVIKTLDTNLKQFKAKLSVAEDASIDVFKALKVDTELKETNDFVYTITDSKTNTVNKFEIKLTSEQSYLLISSIDKL
ncbi:MOLPALP family lipoprotein [Spiroplasma gladiatoris]|uniref:MOLPALP family lipoprotein n=1 Tax=Spiroplasma gladiatoris TaxID=2143 RepID=A0A4P7AJF2_9MOLU|nr:hypothetical protein [Spiroplasma gladiatoris]QBQ07873.1 MOLPALP family lipoprotein [Spiroplasma gladiatoris]